MAINQTTEDLVTTIRLGQAVLLAGAGCSKFVGFPLWRELVVELHQRFAPALPPPDSEDDLPGYTNRIKATVDRENRQNEYFKYLHRRFRPNSLASGGAAQGTHDEFHRVLVKAGFRGLVTTNYDIALECALQYASAEMGSDRFCKSIDLCDRKKQYEVQGFLRSLARSDGNTEQVLHLHGYYDSPESMIVTHDDYRRHYGELRNPETGQQVPLDSLHRKVIWSLLASYSVVFVGFSMDDDVFMTLLAIVQKDFRLQGDIFHFALLPETDRERMPLLREQYCVQPVYYRVVPVSAPSGASSHNALKTLVYDIVDAAGGSVQSSSTTAITRRMLDLP